MGAPEVKASRSVTHLAVKEHVAASTQNQALSALLFLYREVLHQELGPVDALRIKRPKRLPTRPMGVTKTCPELAEGTRRCASSAACRANTN